MVRLRQQPPAVPADLWSHPTILDAARRRHMGRLIAAYRRHPHHGIPISQEIVGAWVGVTQGQISRMENGQPEQNIDRLIHWARLLGIPAHLLWFTQPAPNACIATGPVRQSPAQSLGKDSSLVDNAITGALDDLPVSIARGEVPWQLSPPGGASALDLDGRDDVDFSMAHVRRRSLLLGLATVTAAAGIVGASRGPRRRIGLADISRLTALTSLYRLADQEFGGGSLFADVSQFAESASALLDHVVSDALRPQLLVAIASARDLAGWTAFDASRHSDAQRHFAAAERFAIDAGDRHLAAHVRYGQAKQMQHLRHNRDALDILRGAHHQLDATPALTTILCGAEAASRAAIGEWDGAKQALDLASEAFTNVNVGNEPEWLGFLDKGELLAQYGRVYRDWARADRRHGGDAVRWVTDAISAFGPQNTRSMVLNQVGLASAYFLADAPDLALKAGDTARRQAATLTSPRVIERIANLRRDATQHMHLPEVADFVRALPQATPVA
ncbi:helix-turn-helix domain-containing protein [Dactylosporangium sp. CA-139066]|uniref:helix-turn-helix domain-containing protein n=1 Tax=Dactylosporangium sp. CA-139066 TaxID=3239930 RepID=UPI003D8F7960